MRQHASPSGLHVRLNASYCWARYVELVLIIVYCHYRQLTNFAKEIHFVGECGDYGVI